MKVHELIEKLNGPYTIVTLGKEIGISKNKLSAAIKKVGMEYDKSAHQWIFKGDKIILEHDIHNYVYRSTPVYTNVHKSTIESESVHIDTYEILDVPNGTNEYTLFTSEEMNVLKRIIQDYQFIDVRKYMIYEALERVPNNVDQERIANNISKETSTRLKQFAKERRLPLQDLVELAIIELLDKYNK